jgi:plasmid stabilization system protein ParE
MIKSYSSSLRARTFLEKVLDEFDASDPEEALHLLRRMKQLLARYHEERTKLRRLGLSDIDEVFDAMLAMKRRAERLQERVDAYRAAQEKLRAIQDALDVDASPEQTVRTIEDISDQLESLYEEREVLSRAGVSDATEAVRLIETMREQLGEVYEQVDGEAPDAAPGAADSEPSDSDPDTVTDMVERIEEQLGVAAVPHSTSENGTGPSALPTLVRTLERQMLAAQAGEADLPAEEGTPLVPRSLRRSLDERPVDELRELDVGVVALGDDDRIRLFTKHTPLLPGLDEGVRGDSFFECVPGARNPLLRAPLRRGREAGRLDARFVYTFPRPGEHPPLPLLLQYARSPGAHHTWLLYDGVGQ